MKGVFSKKYIKSNKKVHVLNRNLKNLRYLYCPNCFKTIFEYDEKQYFYICNRCGFRFDKEYFSNILSLENVVGVLFDFNSSKINKNFKIFDHHGSYVNDLENTATTEVISFFEKINEDNQLGKIGLLKEINKSLSEYKMFKKVNLFINHTDIDSILSVLAFKYPNFALKYSKILKSLSLYEDIYLFDKDVEFCFKIVKGYFIYLEEERIFHKKIMEGLFVELRNIIIDFSDKNKDLNDLKEKYGLFLDYYEKNFSLENHDFNDLIIKEEELVKNFHLLELSSYKKYSKTSLVLFKYLNENYNFDILFKYQIVKDEKNEKEELKRLCISINPNKCKIDLSYLGKIILEQEQKKIYSNNKFYEEKQEERKKINEEINSYNNYFNSFNEEFPKKINNIKKCVIKKDFFNCFKIFKKLEKNILYLKERLKIWTNKEILDNVLLKNEKEELKKLVQDYEISVRNNSINYEFKELIFKKLKEYESNLIKIVNDFRNEGLTDKENKLEKIDKMELKRFKGKPEKIWVIKSNIIMERTQTNLNYDSIKFFIKDYLENYIKVKDYKDLKN